jgi:hypothetical protein
MAKAKPPPAAKAAPPAPDPQLLKAHQDLRDVIQQRDAAIEMRDEARRMREAADDAVLALRSEVDEAKFGTTTASVAARLVDAAIDIATTMPSRVEGFELSVYPDGNLSRFNFRRLKDDA